MLGNTSRESLTNWLRRGEPPLNLFLGNTAAFPVYAIRLACRSSGITAGALAPRSLIWLDSQSSTFCPGSVLGAPWCHADGHWNASSGTPPSPLKSAHDQCTYPFAG